MPALLSSTFQEATIRIMSGHDTFDTVTTDMGLSRKQFKRYLVSHGHQKHLDANILLFDLNGTLCHRTERNKNILLRPNIQELRKLKKKYRIGVYTSCANYNALKIINEIEDVCGKLFDRNLIFTREHNIPFTEEERIAYGFPEYKLKKSVAHIFAPEIQGKVKVIDDECLRVVEKEAVIPLHGWYGDDVTDTGLADLVAALMAEQ
jgi:hypothetical protein